MTPQDLTPVSLMIEMRERLVRIETKMDSSAEKVETIETRLSTHETRIADLEGANQEMKTRLATLKWVGGAVVTVATLFGDKLLQLF